MKEIVNDGFAKVVKPYMDAQDKKSREIIAPVEVSPAEAAHSAGDQIIFNGILYDVIAPIAINDALSTSGAGANISAADNIEAQIKATKSQIQTAAAQAAAQNKNTQEMIAPVEEDETDASRAYAIGDQLILDGVLYNVIDAIAQHGIITSEGAGANIEEADNVTDQLSSLNGALTNAFTKQSTVNGAVNELDHTGVTDTSGTVKFTVNEDKSITVSADSYPVTLDSTITFFFFGTNSAAVSNIFKGKKFTGCPSGNTSDKVKIAIQGFSSATPSSGTDYSDTGNGVIIGNENYIRMYIRLGSGYQLTSALTFKPMISLPELKLSYADYVPYAKTNRQLTEDSVTFDDLSEVGVVNYAPNILADKTVSGVTLTIDSDGVINQYSTGAPSAQITEIIGSFKLKSNHTYRLANQKDGSVLLRVSDLLIVRNKSTQTWLMATDNDTRLIYTPSEDVEVELVLRITTSASALDNVKFYSMVCPVSYNGPYVPYAKTNKELTDEVATASTTVTGAGITMSISKWGKVCTLNFTGSFTEAVQHDVSFMTIPEGFRTANLVGFKTTAKLTSISDYVTVYLKDTGTVELGGANAAIGDVMRGAFTYICQ